MDADRRPETADLIALCAALSLCTVGTVLAQSNATALAFISVSLFLIYIASSAAWATVPIAAPSQYTASLGSIQNFGGYLGGALAPTVTGFIVQRTGGFSQALLLSAGMSMLSAAAYLLLVRKPIQADDSATRLSRRHTARSRGDSGFERVAGIAALWKWGAMKRLVLLSTLLAAAMPAADSRIVPGMNAFTIASYQKLAAGDANLILSPFNIATALSMANAGARGQTAEEIQTVLHIRLRLHVRSRTWNTARRSREGRQHGGQRIAHRERALGAKRIRHSARLRKHARQQLSCPAKPLDFHANPDAARSQINRWTEEHTKDKIKNLFPAGSLDAGTRLVLTSAIYFYGKWQEPFLTSHTQPAPFTLPGGSKTQASFMNQTSHFGYIETPSAQILEMRYAGTGIGFDVLLPKNAGGLTDLEKSLTAENLTGWLGNLAPRTYR